MLKKDIPFTDFNGEQQVETHYFNIAPHEMMELGAERGGELGAWLHDIVKQQDTQQLVEQFKRIILLACGEKSPDGKRFIKNDEVRANFESSAAFIALYTEMISDEGAAAEFINGVVPKEALEKMAAAEAAAASKTPPPVPPRS